MKTIKIAIVDDNNLDIDHLTPLLVNSFSKAGYNIDIDVFNRGINFVEPFNDIYDVVFLDINMAVMSGLETAQKIREYKSNTIIVFQTNYASLAVDGYGVGALGFIVKPVKEEDVEDVTLRIIEKIKEQEDDTKIVIKVKSGYQTLKIKDIKYIEVNIHDIFYHTVSGTYKTRGVLKDIEQSINSDKFVKCSNSFLLNLDFVDSIDKDDVKIDGTRIKISRNKRKDFLDAFLNYYK